MKSRESLIVITGAAGWLGANILDVLQKKFHILNLILILLH